MSKVKPIVDDGFRRRSLGQGESLPPDNLPSFHFPNGEFTVSAKTLDCGLYQYQFTAKPKCDVLRKSCKEVVLADVQIELYCEGCEVAAKQVIIYEGLYYVSLESGNAQGNPTDSTKFSKGFTDFSVAIVHATTL